MVKTYFSTFRKIENLIKNNQLELKNLEYKDTNSKIDLEKIKYDIKSQDHFQIQDFHFDLVPIFNHIIQDKTKYINIVKNLGEGVYGKVILPEYKGEEIFVIKESKNVNSDLATEAIIGFCLNGLRNLIPNFVFSYSYFECGADDGSHICSLSKKNEYLAIELISNARTLDDLTLQLSYEEMLDVFLQLFSAIDLAQYFYNFVHYDLHNQNVLLQQNVNNIEVNIFKDGKQLFKIVPKYIVRIIDFGMARVKIHDKIIYEDRSKYISSFDMYKIIMFSLEKFLEKKQTAQKNILIKLFYQFFDSDVNFSNFILNSLEIGSFYEYEGAVRHSDLYEYYLKEIYV